MQAPMQSSHAHPRPGPQAGQAGLAALAAALDQAMERLGASLAASRDAACAPEAMAEDLRELDTVRGALALAGEHGLAALTEQFRCRLFSRQAGESQQPPALHEQAALLRTVLVTALERKLSGNPVCAADLMPAWDALSLDDGGHAPDPSPLLSLADDPDICLPLPEAAETADCRLPEVEASLLALLRADSRDTCRAPGLSLARVLACIARDCADAQAQLQWQVLHAFLIELVDGSADLAPARQILARMLRTLRHRGDDQGKLSLAALARQILLALSRMPPTTEAARQAALKFRLARQMPPDRLAQESPFPAEGGAGAGFLQQLDAWLVARESAGDMLGTLAEWQQLSAAAAQSASTAPLATVLERLAARISDFHADRAACLRVAAAMLCVRAWAAGAGPQHADGDRVARWLEQAAGPEPATARQALEQLMQLRSRRPLLHILASACRDVLDNAERELDAAGTDGWPQAAVTAVRALERIGAALHLLGAPDLPQASEALRMQLDGVSAGELGAGERLLFAQAWVALSHQIGLLPWSADARAGQTDTARFADGPTMSLSRVFCGEAAGLLARLRSALLPAEGLPSPADLDDALHAAHTLAGCSSTIGLPAMAGLAMALESALAPAAEPASAAGCTLWRDAIAQLDEMLARFVQGSEVSPATALLARLAERGQAVPTTIGEGSAVISESVATAAGDGGRAEHSPAAGTETPLPEKHAVANAGIAAASAAQSGLPEAPAVQDELLAIFMEEAADLLPELEQLLQRWQLAPDDRSVSAAMLRVLHTLKGSARMAGLLGLGDEVHRCEAELATIAQLAPTAVAAQLGQLQATIDRWRSACAGDAAARTAELPLALPVPSPVPQAAVQPALPAAPPRLVRVQADLVERFADAAAGLWVGHARISEGMQQQRRTAADFADNLARLGTQLRELEIDAESRIHSGAALSDPAGFDPLEMDRYTRLHEITRMMAETAADLGDLQRSLQRRLEDLSQASDLQARELRRLQSQVQAMRSQPFETIEPRLRHVLRQAAHEAGREINLQVDGGAAKVERSLLDKLAGPLEHLLRNAAVHGIEPPAEREARGKPRTGQLVLGVHPSAAELQLVLSDDGQGLDYQRIHARALAVGLLPAGAEIDPQQLTHLIFEPGFSTASEVTALAGRGIGLDAVSAELRAQGGRISVDSTPGQGCRFTLAVPLSLATLPVLLVHAGRHRIALPAASVRQLLQLRPEQLLDQGGHPCVRWQEQMLPLIPFGQLLGEMPASLQAGSGMIVALLQDAGRWLALQVDAVDGQRELVVRHPGPQLARVPGLIGASLLGDGGIALIMDPFRLRHDTGGHQQAPSAELRPLVLVVDDSLTVRRASQRLLERHGFAVALARDGAEALEQLAEARPAVVLLDIEMPRMDGFELLSVLRDDPRHRGLPVVMITSRIAERHRERARRLGADAYLGKPYQETELIGLVAALCEQQRAA